MATTRKTYRANVGATGRRRIVPMMGIDFIAGDIARRGEPVPRYGVKPASLGGRTRTYSTINFLTVKPSDLKRRTPATPEERQQRINFSNAVKSSAATLKDITVLTRIGLDWNGSVVRQGVNPDNYATVRGWVTAVRLAQIADGQTITPTTTDWTWT